MRGIYNVPSVTLEPHGIDANYSRYIKIASDYYGVISTYFKDVGQRGFNISRDRTFVIGSPRVRAPKLINRKQAIFDARDNIEALADIRFDSSKTYVSFFSQPIVWKQLSEIWKNILITAREHNLTILHKAHPEESESRLNDYKKIVDEIGMEEQVVWIKEDPKIIMSASDLMVTVYSASAIEAALHECPVVCISNGQNSLPINQHDAINAPLVTSQEEFSDIISSFLKNPSVLTDRIKKFIEDEPQFFEGPEENLEKMVSEIISKEPSKNIRSEQEVGSSLFLDSPYQVFDI